MLKMSYQELRIAFRQKNLNGLDDHVGLLIWAIF